MAMPKKGRRTITVADLKFYWTVSVDKDQQYDSLFIQHTENTAAKIIVHDTVGPVTPHMVRQVLETALKSGWNPYSATKELFIPDAWKLYPVVRTDLENE